MISSIAIAPRHSALAIDRGEDPISWVRVAPGAPYFTTEDGDPWTPVGHNDALPWPTLRGILESSQDTASYFRMLQTHGVTCLRLMLEYAEGDDHLFERPAGQFSDEMVRRWDRLFVLLEQHAIRALLTPFDTFWMWKQWACHPYNDVNGGPCSSPREFLISTAAREAIKRRVAFAIDRWAGTGALFAWDLWNEIHPAYARDDAGYFEDFIGDIATFIRDRERARFGRTHLITVSAFGPILHSAFGSEELGATTPDPRALDAIFRHDSLDFATVHTYAHGTIDDPANTVDPAIAMGALTRASLLEIRDRRPFLDSEHGPIHTFKDRLQTLPEHFDAEYFRHLQWAHLASGGAGGGMRWPNRHPHVLTAGMHRAQCVLTRYLPLVRWLEFDRRNLNEEVHTSPRTFVSFACGDHQQVVAWVVRRSPLASDGTLCRTHVAERVTLRVPGLATGTYHVTRFNTETGDIEGCVSATAADGVLHVEVPVVRDLALAVVRSSDQTES